jgi:hypothetical protein
VLAAVEFAPARTGPVAVLEALLDKGFWADAGWDPGSGVLSARAEHPTLGWAQCRVADCDAQSSIGGVCPSCRAVIVAAGSDEVPATSGRSFTGGVGTCAVGCPRPWESRRRPLCAAHEHQCSDVLGVSVLEFLARADVRPLPGFGPCRGLACPPRR